MQSLIVILILFGVLWLLLIRPQRRRQQETERMLGSLRVGLEVVTAGGMYGEITAIEDEDVWLEIAPDLVVKVARRAIAGVNPPDDEVEEDEEEEHAEEDEPEVQEDTEPPLSGRG